MASNAVFFLVKSHISSISTSGKVAFSLIFLSFFLYISYLKKRKGRVGVVE